MSKNWTKHFLLIPGLTFLGISAGLLAIWAHIDRVEQRMLDLRTETTTEQAALRLETFIAARLHLVRQLAHQWNAGQINTPERFAESARAIQAEFTAFQAINWIDSDGVIRWLVPEDRNLPAKDRPLAAHPGLGRILAEAAQTNQPRSSGPLRLFQGGRGFGTYFPVMRAGRLDGYINGVFRMAPVVREALQKGIVGDFYLYITDEGEPLYTDRAGLELTSSPNAQTHPLRILDRNWTLTLVPTPATVARYQTEADEVFLAAGLILAAGVAVMLSSSMKRQNALLESEQRLRMAIENMPAMVAAFDRDDQIIVWNRHCERVTGYSSAEIVRNPQGRQLLNPRLVEGGDGQGLGLAEGEDQELLLTCKDGTVRTVVWSNASAELQVPGWHAWGAGVDITERRKTEDALRLTQFAMDHSAVATFWVREDASFSYVNEQACRDLGYTRDELLKLRVFDVQAEHPPGAWKEHWQRINQQGTSVSETLHRRKDGTVFPVEITASPLRYKGQDYQFAFVADITERKRAEEERLAMERTLLETQKLESLGVLAGGVAHDFNNLLTAVLGCASLARGNAPEGSALAANLGHIESAAQQAADLSKQLLAYSGKGRFEVTTFDLRKPIQETEQLLRVTIPKRVAIEYQLGDEPLYLHGDPGQIRQIVMNLVMNAAEAIGEREGKIQVHTCGVHLDGIRLEGAQGNPDPAKTSYLCLQVTDDGPGMDEQVQARIFEPFFSTKGTGRGLGMAAVMGVVRGHRGVIRTASAPGKGTTFRVYLPAAAPPPTTVGEQPPPSEPAHVADGGTILVIDDEESVRAVAEVILADSGYSVLVAEDGQAGVELFEQHSQKVDLVLLDLTMPRMGGRETMQEIRRIRPQTRVLLSSGFDEHQASSQLAGNKNTAFIQKPYRAEQLLRKVREMMASQL